MPEEVFEAPQTVEQEHLAVGQSSPGRNWPKMILAAVLGLALLAAAAYAGYYYGTQQIQQSEKPTPVVSQPTPTPASLFETTPTPDPTADWETYTNTAYGYTLKYPPGWTIGAKGGADVTTFPAPILASPCDYNSGQLCSQIFVETGPYDENHKFDPTFTINLVGPNPDKVTNKTTTKVDNEAAVGFDYFQSNYGDSGRLLYVLVVNHGNTKYTLTYEESQKDRLMQTSNDWRNKKMFDQILSTFKFL